MNRFMITMPVFPSEFATRRLRGFAVSAESQQPVTFGPFRLDRRGRSLTRAGAEITLGRRAFDVLCVLAAAGGEAVSKDALLDQVWPGLTVEENNLQVQISALRKAWGDGMIAT